MRRDDSSPGAYRADVEGEQSEMLEAIRALILMAAPDVDEKIDYGMLNYPGVASLAAQKHYVSLYVKHSVLARHKDAFPGVNCGKSCLRFRRREQIDEAALRDLLAELVARTAGNDE